MKSTISLILIALSFGLFAQQKMSITIDDLPSVDYGLGNHTEITNGLLSALKNHDAPAVAFVNERKLYEDGQLSNEKVRLLELWIEAGHELGNHTYSHMNYHNVNLEEYAKDILKGERNIRPLSEKYSKEFRYFRHPYLRSGANKETSDSLKSFLQGKAYIEAPVTIDNEEYLFAKAYAVAIKKGENELAEIVAKEYLKYMEKQLEYFEKASNDLLGRNMDHVLLIHANYLNAMYLDDLLDIYKKKGYTFTTLEEVMKDPAYQLEVTYFGNWGISWIQRWGMSRGLKGDFFKGEAVTPNFVRELAN